MVFSFFHRIRCLKLPKTQMSKNTISIQQSTTIQIPFSQKSKVKYIQTLARPIFL